MNHPNTLQQPSGPNDEDFDVLAGLIVLAKHKKKILGAALAAAVLSAGISMLLPNEYKATTKLLPPQQTQSSANALLSQLGGIAGAAISSAGIKNPADLYIGMLRSRVVADGLIKKFDLTKAYNTASMERARSVLQEKTVISSGKDGLIVIEVLDDDQKRVALLANAYVSELFNLMRSLAVTDAAQRRLFYERQLAVTKESLTKAEAALKITMEAGGVVSVDSESRAQLEVIARLKAQVSGKEIQLSAMRPFVTNSNPDYRRVEEELNGLRSELLKLENGRGTTPPGAAHQGGLENIKLLRELKYQQMLYEVLAKQYEVARIDEAKDPSVIQVLDPAVEPERKAKPRRALIVLFSSILSAMLAICWAFISEAKQRVLRSPERAARWAELRTYLSFSKGREGTL